MATLGDLPRRDGVPRGVTEDGLPCMAIPSTGRIFLATLRWWRLLSRRFSGRLLVVEA